MSTLAWVIGAAALWPLVALFALCLCRAAAMGDRDDAYRREFHIAGSDATGRS